MDLKLELIILPVSDVDRAKSFYEAAGFRMDIDVTANEDYRVIQFTPPGSECAIILGKGVTSAAPGSTQGLYLIVYDIEVARAELVGRGIDVSELFHDAEGIFAHSHDGGKFVYPAGNKGQVAGPHPTRADYGTYATFSDPDGNGWVLQEVKQRAPGR
ncbi:glyoxalase [Streptomyces sp. NBC_01619]|uniref:VOC family protein n=1 Tax=Streptomyces pratisoli TaxID=3139917 RepID=A0ACC6QFC0_9ACTN|nr:MULTISPECIES: VOC family protein [unclassified Streptomyces]MCX4509298.1 glyoxalase [Streptomyces sp. NBC_01619]